MGKTMKFILSATTMFLVLVSSSSYANETWSPVLSVKLIFPQTKREDPNHPHSEKTLISLSDMAWLPQACTNRGYAYIEKADATAYSLLLAAMLAKSTVQIAVTDQLPAAGVCRVTMTASPTWN
jgi:hypothetical protein